MKNLKDRLNATAQKVDLSDINDNSAQEEQTELYKMSGLFTPGNTIYQINSLNSLIQLIEDFGITELIVVNNNIDYCICKDNKDISAAFDISNILNQDIYRLYPNIKPNTFIEIQYNPFIKLKIATANLFGCDILVATQNKYKHLTKKTLDKAKELLERQNVIISSDIDFSASTGEIFETFKDDKLIVVNNPFLSVSGAMHCRDVDEITLSIIKEFDNRIKLVFNVQESPCLLDLIANSNNVLFFTNKKEALMDPFRWGVSSAEYLKRVLPMIIRE